MTRYRAVLILGLLAGPVAFAMDVPHTDDCRACHIDTNGPDPVKEEPRTINVPVRDSRVPTIPIPLGRPTSYPALVWRLCESCHFEGGPARAVLTHSSRTSDNDYGNWDLDCWACHDPHVQHQNRAYGTTYGKYIPVNLNAPIKEIDPGDPGPYYEPIGLLRTVTSTNIRFTSDTEFVDGDMEYNDDICQACHESTIYYNIVQDAHADYGTDTQPLGRCTACHMHENGFAAAGGCNGCHGTAQGSASERRQVTGSGGDFERPTHHVTDGTTTEIVLDADCQVCHNQVNHQVNADPTVLLNDPDAGVVSTITYDGAGGSLEVFCIRCHDADSSLAFDSDNNPADGRQPFSDGRDPVDMATAWAGSSHDTALVGEACLSCHGGVDSTRPGALFDRNVHGSHQSALLSLSVNGFTNSNAAEQLCLSCHDGVSAAVDILSMMSGPETYTASSGAMVNTRHDVLQADTSYSGARMVCIDCHDPHGATASDPVVDDPDPTDGVTPVAGTTWAGSSLLSEWCIDCHDGTYPLTLTPPTNPLTEIAATYPGDQHGGRDGGSDVNLRLGSGYAQGDVLDCEICHNPGHGDDASGTVYTNLFNLRSVIYDATGTVQLTPDQQCVPGTNVVQLTDASSGNADQCTNGLNWCSACHPDPMGGNKSKGCVSGNCHNHGTSSF